MNKNMSKSIKNQANLHSGNPSSNSILKRLHMLLNSNKINLKTTINMFQNKINLQGILSKNSQMINTIKVILMEDRVSPDRIITTTTTIKDKTIRETKIAIIIKKKLGNIKKNNNNNSSRTLNRMKINKRNLDNRTKGKKKNSRL